MRHLLRGALCAAALSFSTAVPALAQLSTELVLGGYSNPVFVTAPPGDTTRLFVVEQGSGTTANIKVVNLPGDTDGGIFQTVGGLTTGGERGLLGLAFHPQYSIANAPGEGLFYTHQTNSQGNVEIREYDSANGPNGAPVRTLMTITRPASNHNAGWIGFGPHDGLLYISSGDSGGGNDPGNDAQDINDPRGKILRIDVNGDDFPADPTRNYVIPPTNPFFGATPGLDEVYHYGLRNPYRASFDRDNGDLYIGDVGQNAVEEIDFHKAGTAAAVNYGWRPKEGSADNPAVADPHPANAVDPIHEYGHVGAPNGGNVVTGGYVYRGEEIPFLAATNTYFFADFGSQQIWSFEYDRDTLAKTNFQNRTAELDPPGPLSIGNISSFGEDAAGRLYIVDYGGEVFRLVPEPSTLAMLIAGGLLFPAWRARRRVTGG
jgi:hypothetical protein